ncbi:MAG: NnrU family protein [Pseudomonadota bacterium]
MTLLILGLILWWTTHLLPTVGKSLRDGVAARLGDGPYKGIYSLLSLAAMVMMARGYRAAEFADLWYPPTWGVHVNNLLMVLAIGLFGAASSKGNAKRYVRHPQLLSVVVWAAAHLLVNGDQASVVLFGGVGLWALVAIFATNARDGAWVKPAPAPRRKDWLLAAITLVVFVVVSFIHDWLGVWPFPL